MEAADDKLKRLRADLVIRLSEGVIGDLMDRMLEAKVINRSEYEGIRQVNQTSQEKARCLIDTVSRKGPRAIEKLFQSLNNTDPELCYHLGISSKESKHVPPTPPAPVVSRPGGCTAPSPQGQNNELSQMAGRATVRPRRPILLSQSENLIAGMPSIFYPPQSPMDMPHSPDRPFGQVAPFSLNPREHPYREESHPYRPQCRVQGPAAGVQRARPPARPALTGEQGVDDDRREEQGTASSADVMYTARQGLVDGVARWTPGYLTLAPMVTEQREAMGWPSCLGGKPGARLDWAPL